MNKTSEFFVDKKNRLSIYIKNTLAVVMDNTIPPDPEQGGIREELCIHIVNLRSFDSLNLVLKSDKIKRMKLVSNNHFPL